MEGDGKNAINSVATAISATSVLLQPTIAGDIHGPNSIHLPLARDNQKLAFTLENILSLGECERLISGAEALGFGAAGLGRAGEQTVATQFRDSARIIVEDSVLALQMFQRIQPYLPTVWQGRRILGLNEQLKFLRYHPGQKFVAHYDGSFCRPTTSNKTCLTVQLYLSPGEVVGGCTRFMGVYGEPAVSCTPDVGRALIFQHNILHEGEEVRKGVKYTIRTDVEYSGITFLGQLQELIGFGGSPIQQTLRLLQALPILLSLCAIAWARCGC